MVLAILHCSRSEKILLSLELFHRSIVTSDQRVVRD